MHLFRDIRRLHASQRGAVLALGNFDGVHRGHQAILRAASRIAEQTNAVAGVLTFEPHPRRVFNPDAPPFRLTMMRTKLRLLGELGIAHVHALRFTPALYQRHADDFVRNILVDAIGVSHVVVGYDFVFGHGRSGDAAKLEELGAQLGFGCTVVPPVSHGDDVCSSTIIRVNLETGRAFRAAELLGHWWETSGRVQHGDQRGRTIGFPTLNLHLHPMALRPALGVYAVHVGLPEQGQTVWRPGVANIGRRPTVDGKKLVLEVHIFDFQGDIYGQPVRVAFAEYLRPEQKFSGLDALKAQIARDGEAARILLSKPEYAHHQFQLTPLLRLDSQATA